MKAPARERPLGARAAHPVPPALAIDPRLDQVDRFIGALAARDVRLILLLDTQTDADHLSGVRPLAQRTGATMLTHAAPKLKEPARRIKGGETFELGTRTVTILDALGPTSDSLAILVDGHLSLLRAGRRARVLDGGMLAWRCARLPLREGRKRLPVHRQVQLIPGLMVLAGIGLGITVNPWLLPLAALFGAGLTLAGATGTCGLGMPWNAVPVPSIEGLGAAQPRPEE